MDHTYWHRQQVDKPLFPDLLWSRPEHKTQAGKLGIIGGNAHGFSAAAEAYAVATKSGIGSARVLLPNSLQKTVGRIFQAGEYAPSTPSGSFSQTALSEMLELSQWSDGMLVAGNLGHNSETAIALEQFTQKYTLQLTLCGDSIDYFLSQPADILQRQETLLALTLSQLQKLTSAAKFTQAFTSQMGLMKLVDNLHEFTTLYKAYIIMALDDNIIVSVDGQVSTTKYEDSISDEISIAAKASVWWLQNPSKSFEAITSSVAVDANEVS